MRILGVDPGLTRTGYGVIDSDIGLELVEAGYISTDRRDPLSRRLGKIYASLCVLIKDTRPSIMVLEKIFAHYKHPMTAMLMGHARGVISLAADTEGIMVEDIPSTRVKKAVISGGHASKERIQRAVQAYLGLKQMPSVLDVSDALAIAIAYAITNKSNNGDGIRIKGLVLR